MLVMTSTSSGLTFSISVLSLLFNVPPTQHCQALKGLLRYSVLTRSVGITFRKGGRCLRGCACADFAEDPCTRSSTSARVFCRG